MEQQLLLFDIEEIPNFPTSLFHQLLHTFFTTMEEGVLIELPNKPPYEFYFPDGFKECCFIGKPNDILPILNIKYCTISVVEKLTANPTIDIYKLSISLPFPAPCSFHTLLYIEHG